MTILIAGDYSPKDRISALIAEGKTQDIFADIKQSLFESDYSIVNFESVVISANSKLIKKAGPGMHCTAKAVELLKITGFDAVTLANNHFRDYGDEGVNNSIREFEKNKIDYFGGGQNIEEAERVFYKNIAGKQVAFINVCEHEFSIATENRGGSAPLNVIDVSLRIEAAKEKADYVIVIIHGGNEHYQLPSPRMKKTYRFFVKMGADAVVNHHQHCFSGYEVYMGKPIVYGLGNFCFDWKGRRNSIWNEGCMVKLLLDNEVSFEVIPYIQCDKEPIVVRMQGDRQSVFENRILELNQIIINDVLLDKEYDSFCKRRKRSVLSSFTPYFSSYTRIASAHRLLPLLIPKKKLLAQTGLIKCESHRDVLIKALNDELER